MNRPRPKDRSTWHPTFWDRFKRSVPLIELTAVLLALWSSYESRLSSKSAEESAAALRDALIIQQTSIGGHLKISHFEVRQVSEDSIEVVFNLNNMADINFAEIVVSGLVVPDYSGTQDTWGKQPKSFGPDEVTKNLPAQNSQFYTAGKYNLAARDSFLVVVDIQWRFAGMVELAHSWHRFNCWKSEYGEFIPIEY